MHNGRVYIKRTAHTAAQGRAAKYGDWKSERQEIRDEINSLAVISDEEWDAQFDMPENDEEICEES